MVVYGRCHCKKAAIITEPTGPVYTSGPKDTFHERTHSNGLSHNQIVMVSSEWALLVLQGCVKVTS